MKKQLLSLTLILMMLLSLPLPSLAGTARDWNAVAKLPSSSTLKTAKTDGRAPYVVFAPSLPSGGFIEYAVDFRADYLPNGTYLAPFSWHFDLSPLKKTYKSVDSQPASGYCGFQRLTNGDTVAIMTLWNIVCKDKNGKRVTIRPKVIYTAPGAKTEAMTNDRSGEGDFTHVLIPFAWKAGRTYRLLVQLGQVESNGNVKVLMYVQDLSSGGWTHLVDFDTGVKDIYFKSGVAFLEDFSSDNHAAIRTMELSNVRVNARSGGWKAVKKGSFYTCFNYKGSYTYGADSSTFYCLTTGVQKCWSNPGQKSVSVKTASSSRPY